MEKLPLASSLLLNLALLSHFFGYGFVRTRFSVSDDKRSDAYIFGHLNSAHGLLGRLCTTKTQFWTVVIESTRERPNATECFLERDGTIDEAKIGWNKLNIYWPVEDKNDIHDCDVFLEDLPSSLTKERSVMKQIRVRYFFLVDQSFPVAAFIRISIRGDNAYVDGTDEMIQDPMNYLSDLITAKILQDKDNTEAWVNWTADKQRLNFIGVKGHLPKVFAPIEMIPKSSDQPPVPKSPERKQQNRSDSPPPQARASSPRARSPPAKKEKVSPPTSSKRSPSPPKKTLPQSSSSPPTVPESSSALPDASKKVWREVELLVIYDNIIGEGTSVLREGFYKKENKEVAVRCIRKEKAPSGNIEAELRELIKSKSSDANFTHCINFLHDSEFFYIITEYCRGNLLSIINEKEKKRKEVAQRIVKSVCEIHRRGHYIHETLKPSNILFLDEGYNKMRIGDYSVPRITSKTQTVDIWRASDDIKEDSLIGSQASDVFSLGMTLFWILTNGYHPFSRDKKFESDPALERNLRSGIPENLEAHRQDLNEFCGAYDLIKSMIEDRKTLRIHADDIAMHPFNWSFAQKRNFFVGLHRLLERDSERQKAINVAALSEGIWASTSSWPEALKKANPSLFKAASNIRNAVHNPYQTPCSDLIRLLYNCAEESMSLTEKEEMYGKEGVEIVLEIFPTLSVFAYKKVRELQNRLQDQLHELNKLFW